MKNYHIITYGCQMNENDSEKIAGLLEKNGYSETQDPEQADVLILNTCSVRENADDRFFGNLGNFKNLKKRKPGLIIAVCGCMMQQKHIVEKINVKYPFVDIIFGTHNIHRLPELLNCCLMNGERVTEIADENDGIEEISTVKRRYSHKAYVSIAYGCDNFCTYCIVPYTRGREKSRRKDDILSEIQLLAKNGCKEVMLLGQNVNSYNKKDDGGCSFAQLLKEVAKIEGINRIRFMTSHPKDLSDDIIDTIAECEKVCNNIHLPLQSGSDRILKQMNRHYDSAFYLDVIERLKAKVPGITISTDIIVGFPSETDDDFSETLKIVEKCRFDSAFTFVYSPRNGTKAAEMVQESSPGQIRDRFDALLKLQHGIMKDNCERYVGTTEEILVEGISRGNDEMFSGRTKDNKLVNFNGDCHPGDMVNVRITSNNVFYLTGEII